MKKYVAVALAAALVSILALQASAMFNDREEDWELPDKPETVYNPYTAYLDDSINLTNDGAKSWDSVGLTHKLSMKGGKLLVEIKVVYGYTVSARALTDNIVVHTEQVRGPEIPELRQYNYYIMTIEPSDRYRDSVKADEFRIQLTSGEVDLTVYGETVPQEFDYIVPGIQMSVRNGIEYRFTQLDEDELWWNDKSPEHREAVMICPNGLELVFQGNYGNSSADLSTDTALIPEAEDLPGTTEACWTFTESPTFDNDVTVRIKAPEGAALYNALRSGTYLIDTEYEDGYLSFKTQSLNSYILQQK